MNAHELNQRLCQQIESVLKHLFPAGKMVRGEYEVGSLSGEAGSSLKVHLGGAKKGYWSDFASDKKGRSLTGLWAETVGGDFARACKESKAYLGIRDDQYTRRFVRPPQEKAPAATMDRSKIRKLSETSLVHTYLVEERHLDPMVLAAYRVAESSDGRVVVFPFFKTIEEDAGAVISDEAYMAKFLRVERPENKKEIWTNPANIRDSLFGKNAKLPSAVLNSGTLVITEGEIDALSVAMFGYWGVSVPRGAKHAGQDGNSANDQWIAEDYEWLKDFERIYVWMDNDEPGKAAARDIAMRLGLERCYLITTPDGHKDANECLSAGISAEAIAKAFEEAITLDPANLVWATDFMERVKLRIWPPGGVEPGFDLPWGNMPWRIRPGELTVWTGFSGHGKTIALNNLMVHAASIGEVVTIASMEVEPDRTLEVTWCQANGGRFPYDEDEIIGMSDTQRREFGQQRFAELYPWIGERFLVFVPELESESGTGRADWHLMLKCFLYARQRYGCTQFVVDSMMMCVGRSEGEYSEVEKFVNALSSFAKKQQVHVHLVAHSRKKDDETKPPGKQDVAGPKETADIAHNVVVVHRNMKKWTTLETVRGEIDTCEASIRATDRGQSETVTALQKQLSELEEKANNTYLQRDGELHLLKQRNSTGEVGSKYLWFIADARQFTHVDPKTLSSKKNFAKRFLLNENLHATRNSVPRGTDVRVP